MTLDEIMNPFRGEIASVKGDTRVSDGSGGWHHIGSDEWFIILAEHAKLEEIEKLTNLFQKPYELPDYRGISI